jgi:hypothetical protein
VSSELWSTIASVGTFIVIAATAVVAAIQLRHVRSSNQIAAAMSIHNVVESEEFQEARRFIRDDLAKQLEAPEFRRTLGVLTNRLSRPVILVGNYYEEIGIFVKYGLVDENIACEMWANEIVLDWKRMAPAIAIMQGRGPRTAGRTSNTCTRFAKRGFNDILRAASRKSVAAFVSRTPGPTKTHEIIEAEDLRFADVCACAHRPLVRARVISA